MIKNPFFFPLVVFSVLAFQGCGSEESASESRLIDRSAANSATCPSFETASLTLKTVSAPNRATVLVVNGRRLNLESPELLNFLSRGTQSLATCQYDQLPDGGSISRAQAALFTPGYPAGFKNSFGFYPIGCLEGLIINQSSLSEISPAEYSALRNSGDLKCPGQ